MSNLILKAEIYSQIRESIEICKGCRYLGATAEQDNPWPGTTDCHRDGGDGPIAENESPGPFCQREPTSMTWYPWT